MFSAKIRDVRLLSVKRCRSRTGKHFWEVTFEREHGEHGEHLGGDFFVGVTV